MKSCLFQIITQNSFLPVELPGERLKYLLMTCFPKIFHQYIHLLKSVREAVLYLNQLGLTPVVNERC